MGAGELRAFTAPCKKISGSVWKENNGKVRRGQGHGRVFLWLHHIGRVPCG